MVCVLQFSVILLCGVILGIESAPVDQCIGTCPKDNSDNDVVHLPHKDCSKFCKCDLGTPHVMSCPYGLFYNSKLQVCDYLNHSGCGKNHFMSIPPSFFRSMGLKTSLTLDDASGCKGTCPTWEGDDVVQLPHQDCKKFCKCDFGIAFVFECPNGLHYNPKLGVCDRPSHAGCATHP